MQNGVSGHPGWGLAEATRELLETADAAEIARRDRQVNRAITAFLARPAGSAQLDEALADQRIILAHHFGVPEDYFTDPGVGAPVAERRRHPAPASPAAPLPPSTTAADPVVPQPRRRVGVAALAVGVLAGAAVGGAAGYQVGVGAARPGTTVAAPANAAAIDHSAPDHAPAGSAAPSLRAAPTGPAGPAVEGAPAGVVQVRVQSGTAAATGSGVVLRDGLLLTDDHLFAHPGPVAVQLRDGAVRPAHLVGRDPVAGIAVLAADPAGLVPAALGNSDAVRVGQHVRAVGWAHDHPLTDRTVRGVNRPAAPAPAHPAAVAPMIETDAAGTGPLLDARGAVIGVGTVAPAPPGTGYAIPINQAVRAADRLITANRAARPVPPRPAAHAHAAVPGVAPAVGHPVP
jgi:putative serine protease PepD